MEPTTESPEAAPTYPVCATFEAMDLSAEVRQAITDEMKYASPTPVQAAAFAPIRAGRDVVVQSRTGTGKTAAFGIPLADLIDPAIKAPQLLVLAPTRELANQDGTELERLNRMRGNRVLSIYGGAAFGPQLEGLKAGAQIIAGTPGRVLDHLRRGTLKLDRCRYLVLDEADEMLSMGFQDELENILDFVPRGKPGDQRARAQTMLFSATFPGEIRRMIDKHLREPLELTLTQGNIAPEEITHFYYVTSHMRKPAALLTVIEYEEPESALVFTNTREDANFVGGFMRNRNLDAEVLTGELTQSAREKVMRKIKAGNLRFLVATDVAARGIDIADLSHVINYNLPESPEVYVHRTGRTGRAGKAGSAVSIVSGLDISTLYALTKWMKIRLEERPLPTDAQVKAHRLDREVKKLVGEVRGRIEEGAFSEPDNKWLALAEKVIAERQSREIVATLLERVLVKMAESSVTRQATPVAEGPEPGAVAPPAAPVTTVTAGTATTPEGEVSIEQREFEEQQMRKSREPRGRGGPRGERPERGRERGAPARGREGADRPPRSDRDRAPRSDADRKPADTAAPKPEATAVAKGDVKTLMITLGKRSKMGPREVGLFMVGAAGIDVSQVKDVRVRDTYSFVDVDTAIADAVIAKVNGVEHDGKKVKVEAARARGEGTK